MEPALLVGVVLLALGFAWTNGVHDAANAIAAPVVTRALTPRVAVVVAAAFNLVGALIGQSLVETIAGDLLVVPAGVDGLWVLASALVGAIAWNLLTWWQGLPSSSTHALAGGLVGAGLSSATSVRWGALEDQVLVPVLVFPVLALVLAVGGTALVLRLLRGAMPHRAHRRLRMAQTVASAAMALGHGLQDAQKTMAVVVLAFVAAGVQDGGDVPLGVRVGVALAIALGTAAGGWRIVRTLGERLVPLDPLRGFVAQAVASTMLYVAALALRAPVSTTQTVTTAILGAGGVGRWRRTRWDVAGRIAAAWLLTVPAAGALSAALYLLAGALR